MSDKYTTTSSSSCHQRARMWEEGLEMLNVENAENVDEKHLPCFRTQNYL